MICMFCETKFNYSYYIDDEYWIKIVGEENFKKNVGHVCAHCALEKIGGVAWHLLFSEPLANISANKHVNWDKVLNNIPT